MAGKHLTRWLWLVVTLMLLLMCGCGRLKSLPGTPNADDQTGQGSLKLMANLNEISDTPTGMQVELTLKKNTTSLVRQVPVVDGVASLVLDDLLPGVWQITLAIKDADGYTQYIASDQVSIVTGTTASTTLSLRPCPGVLEVNANPALYSALANAQKARLYVNPGGYSAMTLDENGIFTGSKELAPGTYDYSVTFYNNGYLVSDILYESPWTTVSIQPGKQLILDWDPGTGGGAIDGHIDAPPPIPNQPQLQTTTEGLLISWDSVTAPDLAGYRIYLRQTIFGKFELICEQPTDQTTALYAASKLKLGLVEVAITAYDLANNESERSTVAYIIWK